ncbi:MAG: deoxynucleoside kinase [Patescibacteria group bacterium]|nr:deoxynucleoside kinase [Patescibacteria group bacterium]
MAGKAGFGVWGAESGKWRCCILSFMVKRGKLIVIDGTDGVGKATQTKLLVARLKKEGVPVKTLDFPQYYKNFFGHFIGAMLTGEYGDFLHMDPFVASVMYAADRFESKPKIEKWLADGYTVILDRYVSANQLHQAGKIKDAKKRKYFLKWLDTMEHKVFGLPRPDLIIYLHLPMKSVVKLLKQKDAVRKKRYAKGKKDTVEQDTAYLEAAQKSALELIKTSRNWKKIECANPGGGILLREEISEKIYTLASRGLIRK